MEKSSPGGIITEAENGMARSEENSYLVGWMNLRIFRWLTPNQLTSVRILVIPPLLFFIFLEDPLSNSISCAVFFFACITDYYDGILARTRHEVSTLGKLLDPIADKMLISSALIMLVYLGKADVVPTILILLREFAVSGLRQVAAVEGVVISAARGAKYKTALQMFAVGFLVVYHDPFGLPTHGIGRGLLWLAMVLTLWTGYGYFKSYYGNDPTPREGDEKEAGQD